MSDLYEVYGVDSNAADVWWFSLACLLIFVFSFVYFAGWCCCFHGKREIIDREIYNSINLCLYVSSSLLPAFTDPCGTILGKCDELVIYKDVWWMWKLELLLAVLKKLWDLIHVLPKNNARWVWNTREVDRKPFSFIESCFEYILHY